MTDIEFLAEQFLASVPGYVWDATTLPVPVEDIADSHVGLLVRDVADLQAAPGAPPLRDGQTLSGLLLPARGEIWVNAQESETWPARRRFTIAHELGHWQMHRSSETSVFCRSAVIEAALEQNRPDPAPAEEEANAFAAAVLMPARLVRERYASAPRDFRALCQAFNASGAAMGRRLHAVIPPTR
jgi:IrrE N-terminal-like domain